jgi:hypothetical protein
MFTAAVALVLLVKTGVSWPTLAAALVATGLTAISRRLFRMKP